MNTFDSDTGHRNSWPKMPFQFSLKTLLLGITLVAVVLGLSSALPSLFLKLVWPIAASIVFPSLLMVGLFGRGHRQAFAAGSLLTLVVGFTAADSLVGSVLWLFLAVFSGFVAMWMRVWVEENDWNKPE